MKERREGRGGEREREGLGEGATTLISLHTFSIAG